jgi:hypothetical protein
MRITKDVLLVGSFGLIIIFSSLIVYNLITMPDCHPYLNKTGINIQPVIEIKKIEIVVPAKIITESNPVKVIKNIRHTAYSPKQPGEGSLTSTGKSARNEKGIAVPRSWIRKGWVRRGSIVKIKNGHHRIVDDDYPSNKSKEFDDKVIDVRWYESITAPAKTKQVNRELMRKFDLGCGTIIVMKY